MAITSLWPEEIRPRILSPKSILRAQAEALEKQTRGVLVGELKTEIPADQRTRLDLSIVVPSLDNFRHHILTVAYEKNLPYPALIDAEVFRPLSLNGLLRFLETGASDQNFAYRADNDREFAAIVERILESPQVLTVAQSLIARATEALDEGEPSDQSAETSASVIAGASDKPDKPDDPPF